jgi:hypothetical protein
MTDQLDLQAAWAPYAAIAIRGAVKFASEAPSAVVPSIVLMPDGLKMAAIFVTTASYLLEVAPDASTFDIIDRRRVRVIRWFFGTQVVQKEGEGASSSYETALIHLNHMANQTQMNFVGPKRNAWVEHVQGLFPASLVLQRSQPRTAAVRSPKQA